MPKTGAGGLGGVTGGCDGVTRGRVAKRGLSHTSHSTLLPAFITVQLLHCHSEGQGQIHFKMNTSKQLQQKRHQKYKTLQFRGWD